MSDPHFWQGLDDDDPVPVPVPVWPPPTLGELRRDTRQARRLRARAWALAEVQIQAEMRQPYARLMALPGLTQPQTRAVLTDAFRRVAMAVYDECAAAEAHRRRNAPAAHSASVRDEQEERWGEAVRGRCLSTRPGVLRSWRAC